jgi:hypothetical protein
MSQKSKIENLKLLKTSLENLLLDSNFLVEVEYSNPWFLKEYTTRALRSIISELLDSEKLNQWMNSYEIKEESKMVGLIAAGNIPLVSFHDLLCVYMSPHRLKLKISSKDIFLTKSILDIWMSIDESWRSRVELVERIEGCDKIIATGSNNSYKYFEHYFAKYDTILRKNRSSIAILKKDITDRDLDLLMDDVFLYFGLGCRNVSKLWIEEGFNLERIFEASERFDYLFAHTKYMNNYDYQRTILLLNKVPHLSNNFLILKEDSQIFSPISRLNYQWYSNQSEISIELNNESENIQCVVGDHYVPFGHSQLPSLSDYADGVDTMKFLIS